MAGSGRPTGEDVVLAAGQRLAVRRIGTWERCDPVLVFLHEGLGSISMWRDFPDRCAAVCALPALVYDRHGHGGSEPLAGERPARFLDREGETVLPQVLSACAVRRPLLFGHSDGGTIALMFAAAFPDRPVAVVAEAAHVFREPATLRGLSGLAARWEEDDDFRRRLARHHGDGTEAMVRGFLRWWTAPERAGWDMRDRLGAITCPVLALQGEEDEHGTRAQVDEILARVGGPARGLMIPACGHVPHHAARDAVLAATAQFVRSVPGL